MAILQFKKFISCLTINILSLLVILSQSPGEMLRDKYIDKNNYNMLTIDIDILFTIC